MFLLQMIEEHSKNLMIILKIFLCNLWIFPFNIKHGLNLITNEHIND